MRVAAACSTANVFSVSHTDNSAAAWFVRRPCGLVVLTINDARMSSTGAREGVEAWYRLRALTQGRPFGVMPASELALYAPYVAGHVHDDAVPA